MIPLVLPTLSACTPVVADYQITLRPTFVGGSGDELFAEGPDAKLVVRHVDGDVDVYGIGAVTGGAAFEIPLLPPLDAGTWVGLVFEQADAGEIDIWHRDSTLAYGEVALAEALGKGGAVVELDVLVLRLDQVTRLGKLGPNQLSLSAATAVGPDQTFYLFGGGDPAFTANLGLGVSSDKVYRLGRTETGWEEPQLLDDRIPAREYDYNYDTVSAGDVADAMALSAELADGPRIFLFGGRWSWGNSGFGTADVFEFDPLTDTFVLDRNGDVVRGELVVPRSGAIVLPVGTNKAVVYGGQGRFGIQPTTTYEVFSLATMSSELADLPNGVSIPGNFGAFGTTLGSDAAICAGAFVDIIGAPNIQLLTPTDQCFLIGAGAGAFDEIAPLPEPLFAAALAPLPDGGLLVTGGTSATLDRAFEDPKFPSDVEAGVQAYRWDPTVDEWFDDVGDLVLARAHHRMVAQADGRILVIGGTAHAAHQYVGTGAAITATEIYDPETRSFALTGQDNAAGAGQDPPIAGPPGGPWFVLEGASTGIQAAPTEGGATYGVIGGQPPL